VIKREYKNKRPKLAHKKRRSIPPEKGSPYPRTNEIREENTFNPLLEREEKYEKRHILPQL